MKQSGEELEIKDSKTIIKQFNMIDGKMSCTYFDSPEFPEQSKAPIKNKDFEYLGFSFDGETVKLRDSTVSRFYRKIAKGVRKEARVLVDRYSTLSKIQVLEKAKLSQIYQRYGRINDFYDLESDDYDKWNFWTYAKRAAEVMDRSGLRHRIIKQISRHKEITRQRLSSELSKSIAKKSRKRAA